MQDFMLRSDVQNLERKVDDLETQVEIMLRENKKKDEVIQDLLKKHQWQREDFDNQLEQGYQEAYEVIREEKKKVSFLEVDLYNEYDKKTTEFKDYVVAEVDKYIDKIRKTYGIEYFCQKTGEEIVSEAMGNPASSDKEKIRVLEAKNIRNNVTIAKLTEELIQLKKGKSYE